MSLTKEVEVEITDEDIHEYLDENKSWDELIEFVKEIDNRTGDWGFTQQLIQALWTTWRDDHGEDLELDDQHTIYLQSDSENEEEDVPKANEAPRPDEDPNHNHVFRSGSCYCGAYQATT